MRSWRQHRRRQPPRCLSHHFPAPQKNQKPKKTFNVFHSPDMVPKSTKNAPRITPEAPKLSPKWQPCHYRCSIFELMLAHLGALARHLAYLVRHLGADMASNSKQNAIFEPTSSKTASKMPQPPLLSTPKVQKTKEN